MTSTVLGWSGGKDSSLALATLLADPTRHGAALLTSVTNGYDRISIHGMRRTLLHAQANALGLPLIEVTLEPHSTNEAYESAFLNALSEVRTRFPAVTEIAFGDLYLADVHDYRERLVAPTPFTPVFPLWGRDTGVLAREFVDAGFVAHLVCVDTTQLSAAFAGQQYDHALLSELPASVDPCGEGGEFHTFVSAGPLFLRDVPISIGDVVLRDSRFAYCDLLPATR